MKCQHCGTENQQDARFCCGCGQDLSQQNAAQQVPQQPQQPQRPVQPPMYKPNADMINRIKGLLTPKNITIAAAGVLALVVVIAVVSLIGAAGNTPKYLKDLNDFSAVFMPEDEVTQFVLNGELLEEKLDGRCLIAQSNAAGDVNLIEVYEYMSDGSMETTNTYYVFMGKELLKVGEDIFHATLSRDGSVVAYTDEDDTMYTLSLKDRKIKKIADEVETEFLEYVNVFSPNGKRVMYAQSEGDDFTTFVVEGDKKTAIENFVPLFLSDKGNILYGANEEGEMGVYDMKKEDTTKLANSEELGSYYINVDGTEFLFSYDSKYYLSVDGGERVKLGNYEYMEILLPDDHYSTYSGPSAAYSFVGAIFACRSDWEYDICYLDEKYEMQTLVRDVDSWHLTDDQQTLYFTRDYNLYVAHAEDEFEADKLASDVTIFRVTSNGKKVYYINDEYELYCRAGEEKNKIAEDVSTYYFRISKDDVVFFMTDYDDVTGILYRCSDGENKVRITDDATGVFTGIKTERYYTDAGDALENLYISKNSKDFKLIAEEIG